MYTPKDEMLPELDPGGAVVAIFEFLSGFAEAGHHAPADLHAAAPAHPVAFAHQLQRRLQHLFMSEMSNVY